jgi:hypothetical protein
VARADVLVQVRLLQQRETDTRTECRHTRRCQCHATRQACAATCRSNATEKQQR